ncbi:MAG: U32 family peptidase [Clostridiales bacterium]|nr:U32 family peptidase [Clostridiales bacterium]
MSLEILAPAGGYEQLVAAVRCGADAVYLGAGGFNARQNAENFAGERLSRAVGYAHVRRVKVYVTLNTLVKNEELEGLAEEIKNTARSGADAVIVQDLAVAALVRRICPDLPLHASTQMTVHNISGVRELERLGFSRVVLARELSADEIAEISHATDMEVEIFVHGAHCMSVSGACYLSAMLGGRSGNRGCCAQPCRLDFSSGDRHYALSLKDMSYFSHIQQLRAAGVASLKIEGRMKRPEYVAAAVSACALARSGEKYDLDSLRSVFSRSGFTDGYLTGKRTLDMFGSRTKQDVEAASTSVLKALANTYSAERQSVGVSMRLCLSPDEAASLEVTDGENTVRVSGDIPQVALNRALDSENACRSLKKTGGTPFFPEDMAVEVNGNITLPASSINEMRRKALCALLEKREAVEPHRINEISLPEYAKKSSGEVAPAVFMRFERQEQIFDTCEAEKIILPLREIKKSPSLIGKYAHRLVGEIPALMFGNQDEKNSGLLCELAGAGLKYAYCENLGAVRAAKAAGLSIIGGHGLNIMNSIAAHEYEMLGVGVLTASFEMKLQRIKSLSTSAPKGIIAYGYLPLMRFRACPVQKSAACASCSGTEALTDRRGTDFTVLCSDKKYSSLLNSVPLCVSDKDLTGLDFVTLYFTTESAQRCKYIADCFASCVVPDFERTNGLYFRELI